MQPLLHGKVAFSFVIPSEAEKTAVPHLNLADKCLRPERTRISRPAALDKTACAAFSKESRMKSANATKINRKSGVAEWRDLRFLLASGFRPGLLVRGAPGRGRRKQTHPRFVCVLRPKRTLKMRRTAGTSELPPVRKTRSTWLRLIPEVSSSESTHCSMAVQLFGNPTFKVVAGDTDADVHAAVAEMKFGLFGVGELELDPLHGLV